jgi:hypothetical protein
MSQLKLKTKKINFKKQIKNKIKIKGKLERRIV